MPDFVPRHIGTMFGKLHTEAVVRALVKTRDESFDHQSCPELHVGEPGYHLRLEKLSVVGSHCTGGFFLVGSFVVMGRDSAVVVDDA